MSEPDDQPVKRNWNVTGRELSTWRLILLVFPPPIALVVHAAFGPIAAVIAAALLYLCIIWFVVTVPKKNRKIERSEPEDG
ncbi:hypothetical protein [Arthrobacter monumenti]